MRKRKTTCAILLVSCSLSIHFFIPSLFTDPGHNYFCIWYQRCKSERDVSTLEEVTAYWRRRGRAHLNRDSIMHSEKGLVMKIWNRLAEIQNLFYFFRNMNFKNRERGRGSDSRWWYRKIRNSVPPMDTANV